MSIAEEEQCCRSAAGEFS